MVRDYYQVLGVKRTATEAEISKAYRRQIRLWRSRLNAPDLKLRQEAERMLVDLEAAKKVLLNTKQYDSERSNRVNKKHPDGAKRNNKRNKKKFSPVAKLKLALKIFSKGLSSAAKYILNLIGNSIYKTVRYILSGIWNAIKFIGLIVGRLLLVCLFLTGIGGLILFATSIYENQLGEASIGLAVNYITMSIVTFYKYWEDKRKAKRNLWRLSEAELHSFELIGGWFGAFCAQVLLQHKSSKQNYQLVYWLIVLFHVSLWLFFLPAVSPYAIPQKYIVIVNALLLVISLDGIRKKGIMN